MADERPDSGRPDIETLGSRVVYENKWMRVREDQVRRRDGSTGIYGVIEKQDFVVVVPVAADGSITLVQQYRYPIGVRLWEFPLGIWGDPGGDPAEAARHELMEETGLRAERLVHAGQLQLAPGTIRQGYDIFLATGLTQGKAVPEQEEQDLISRSFARTEFDRMVREGEIRDGTTVAVYGLLRLKGLL